MNQAIILSRSKWYVYEYRALLGRRLIAVATEIYVREGNDYIVHKSLDQTVGDVARASVVTAAFVLGKHLRVSPWKFRGGTS